MGISTKPPSGMRDFLPRALRQRRYVTSVIQDVYEKYGFVPLETPSLENLTTLLGKYGDEGDQLLYRVMKRRDALQRALDQDAISPADLADLGLRYDLTVPLARVVAQYGELPKFFKRYQIQPVWRADRPGKGRFREFYQCDVDITGVEGLVAEAEVCSAVCDVLRRLGFDDFKILLNHRGLLREIIRHAGIDEAQETSALVAMDKMDKIGVEGVRKELSERGISSDAATRFLELCQDDEDPLPRLRSELDSEGATKALDDLAGLIDLARDTPAGTHLQVSPTLARGLGYYTGPIFEIVVEDLAGSMGGGGRYDDLVEMFGKKNVPAVGFSLGLERILLVMEQREMYPDLRFGPDLLLCWMDVGVASALQVAGRLRQQGLRVEVYPASTKLGKQIQYADHDGVQARGVAILGPSELENDEVSLKNLATGSQDTVSVAGVGAIVAQWEDPS